MSGKAARTVSSLPFTAATTSRAFSPIRASAMPSTTSSPSRVTAPKRGAGACTTVATSRICTGTPSSALSTIAPMSSADCSRPSPRTRNCSRPMSMTLPPTWPLFAGMALITSPKPRPRAYRRCGSMLTWNSRSPPPHEVTSSTPGAVRRTSRTVHSCQVRRSMSETCSLPTPGARSTVYQYTCPRPEVLGPMPGLP